MQTVEKCIEETQNGHFSRDPLKRIDEPILRSSLNKIHTVTELQRAEVLLNGGAGLDDGERDLWAHALTRTDVWILCGPDTASMRFGYAVEKRDRLVSLESLLKKLGHTPSGALPDHYKQRWLDDTMSKLAIGIL
ncbi:hypothetical protein OQ496_14220 [Acetobacter suratthaniensis]|uniref:Uncharacterized protein n=1 Tax=Acetobacter suratthaniensis TaxID=1502841 RepID=A0ABS3LQE4_9PROT|nr:hypothetical protein [Acetobacter suratthaniensis]MBO1329582.1 hypothetical protein [Acetobacter suratthaniensis]MCX2567597.1 hypothetical protein [Acetobacter suratthaniensis]